MKGPSVTTMPTGSFHHLNLDDVPLNHRIKLARCLWIQSDVMPRKEQSILNWLTTAVVERNAQSKSSIEFAWKTVQEFLNSKQLQTFFSEQPHDIIIKSTFIKAYLETVQTMQKFDCQTLLLMKVGSVLMENDRLSSDLNKKFSTFLEFAAVWLTAVHRLHADCVLDENTVKATNQFLTTILLKVKEKFSRHNNPKKALSVFLDQLCTPCLKHLIIELENKSTDFGHQTTLLASSESLLKDLLFSRKLMDVYENYYHNAENTNKVAKLSDGKQDSVVDNLFRTLTETLRMSNGSGNWVAIIYQLFLTSYSKGSRNMKFHFFSQLVGSLSEPDKEYSAQTVSVLANLIQSNVQQNLYQPTVDDESAKIQKKYYIGLLKKLLHISISPDKGWAQCICSFVEINHSFIEPKLKEVFSKVLQHNNQCSDWLPDFFTKLVYNFTQIRKPLELVKCFVQAFKELEENNASHVSTIQMFASALQSQCICVCPHNTAMDIWQHIQSCLEVHKDTETHETMSSAVILNGRKHKAEKDEDVIKPKKLKPNTENNLQLPNLTFLLVSVMEECHVLDIKEQASTKQRLSSLLQEQSEIISQWMDKVAGNYIDNTMLAFLQLLTVHDDMLHLLRRYSILEDIAWLSTSSDHWSALLKLCETNQMSPRTEFQFRKWQCSLLKWLSWQQCKSDDLGSTTATFEDGTEWSAEDLASKFLSSITLPKSKSDATYNKEAVTDKGESSPLELLYVNFHAFVHMPKTHQAISKLILASLSSCKSSSAVEKILKNASFLECAPLHCCILNEIVQNFSDDYQDVKGVGLALKTSTEVFERESVVDKLCPLIDKLFSDKLWKKKHKNSLYVTEKMFQMSKVMLHLPEIPVDYQPAVLSILLTIVACMKSKLKSAEFPQNLHSFVITIIDNILALNHKLISVIPMEPFLNYLVEIYNSLGDSLKPVAKRLLVLLVNTCCKDEALGETLLTQLSNITESNMVVKLLLVEVMLCTLSTKILNVLGILNLPVAENMFSIFHPTKEILLNRVNVRKAMFQFQDPTATRKNNEQLNLSAGLLKKYLKDYEQNDPNSKQAPTFPVLLSYFALKQTGNSKFGSKLEDTLHSDKTADLQKINNFESLKFVLLRSEILLYQHHKIETNNKTWFFDMNYAMKLYSLSFVKSSAVIRLMVDRIILIHLRLAPIETHVKSFLSENLKSLQITPEVSTIESQMLFVSFLSTLYDSRSKKFQTFVRYTAGDSEEDEQIHLLQVKYIRDVFDTAVGLVGELLEANTAQKTSKPDADILCILRTITKILNLGPAIIHSRLVALVFQALARVQLTNTSLGCVALFGATYEAFNAVVLHHKMAVVNIVPLVLSVCSKLLNFALFVGRQDNTTGDQSALDTSLECTRLLDRLFQFIASDYGSYFKRCVPYTVAEFVTGMSRDTLHPSVKKSLQNAMYHLMSLCDDYSVAMLRSTLPPGVRDVFRHFHTDYEKYFKYTGRV